MSLQEGPSGAPCSLAWRSLRPVREPCSTGLPPCRKPWPSPAGTVWPRSQWAVYQNDNMTISPSFSEREPRAVGTLRLIIFKGEKCILVNVNNIHTQLDILRLLETQNWNYLWMLACLLVWQPSWWDEFQSSGLCWPFWNQFALA